MQEPDMSKILEELLGTTLLPNTEVLVGWRSARAKLDREIQGLIEARDKLDRLIETGADLALKTSSTKQFGFREAARQKARAKAKPGASPETRAGSWTESVYLIVTAATEPLTRAELREELAKMRKIDKVSGWQGALQRLRDTGHIVCENGLVATPEIMESYREDVKAGRAFKEGAKVKSRWQSAVCHYLSGCSKPASIQEIVSGIRTDAELDEKIVRTPNAIYGVLYQLVALGKAERVGKEYRITAKGLASIKSDKVAAGSANGHGTPEGLEPTAPYS